MDNWPSEARTAAELPGLRIGRFVRVCRLGAGGMGEVWKAWDIAGGRWVALKQFLGPEHNRARFQREARMSSFLRHPSIPAVYHATDEYIAYELLPGRALDVDPPRDPESVARIGRDVARAVQHAHELGILHRDLKPSNLLLDGSRVYVLDFGLARTQQPDGISWPGLVIGTPGYLSPEQARGQTDLDERVDVYGIGAVMYDLLSGRPPIEGADAEDTLQRTVVDAPAPLRTDAGLARIVMTCLAPERDERYSSAAEVARALDRWLRLRTLRRRARWFAPLLLLPFLVFAIPSPKPASLPLAEAPAERGERLLLTYVRSGHLDPDLVDRAVRCLEREAPTDLAQALLLYYRDHRTADARKALEEAWTRKPEAGYALWLGLWSWNSNERQFWLSRAVRLDPRSPAREMK